MSGHLHLAVNKYSLWENGQVLSIKFLGGSESVQKQVKKFAKEWENHANIKFQFISDGEGDADIRISFYQDVGSYSQVGKAALLVTDGPTMNLAVMDSTPPAEVKRHVLHEFGHALGCIHEHCSPRAAIRWNVQEVYSYYQKIGWDKPKVDENIFQKLGPELTESSTFDPESIMMYPIPSSHTRNISTSSSWELSTIDRDFIAKVYPKPGKGANRQMYRHKQRMRSTVNSGHTGIKNQRYLLRSSSITRHNRQSRG